MRFSSKFFYISLIVINFYLLGLQIVANIPLTKILLYLSYIPLLIFCLIFNIGDYDDNNKKIKLFLNTMVIISIFYLLIMNFLDLL